jgi:hypothetical protein
MNWYLDSFRYIADTVSLRSTAPAKVHVSPGRMVVMNGTYAMDQETAMKCDVVWEVGTLSKDVLACG